MALRDLLSQTTTTILEALAPGWTAAHTPSTFFAGAADHAGLVTAPEAYAARPLHIAVLAGHVPAVQMLLKAGADVNALDGLARSVFHCAIFGLDTLECTPENPLALATLEQSSPAAMGLTPLGLAARLGKLRTVELLLTVGPGVQVDGRDAQQRTALMSAVCSGKLEVVHALLRHGASVLAEDADGCNVVQLARASGSPELLGLCVEAEQRERASHNTSSNSNSNSSSNNSSGLRDARVAATVPTSRLRLAPILPAALQLPT
ncbi:ankyrin repeat-containing domain protein, partial [Thamnocephalis sphaerospora]